MSLVLLPTSMIIIPHFCILLLHCFIHEYSCTVPPFSDYHTLMYGFSQHRSVSFYFFSASLPCSILIYPVPPRPFFPNTIFFSIRIFLHVDKDLTLNLLLWGFLSALHLSSYKVIFKTYSMFIIKRTKPKMYNLISFWWFKGIEYNSSVLNKCLSKFLYQSWDFSTEK